MAWTTPLTWAVGQLVTASQMNTHVRDNLNYLKGAAGTITFDAGAAITGAVSATTATFSGALQATLATFTATGSNTFAGQVRPGRNAAGSITGSVTIDFNSGSRYEATLTGPVTFTFSNPVAGVTYGLRLLQDATGGRTVTWPGTVKWKAATAPTLSAANKVDIIALYYDGTSYYGDYTLNC